MNNKEFQEKLSNWIFSGVPLIHVKTHEEIDTQTEILLVYQAFCEKLTGKKFENILEAQSYCQKNMKTGVPLLGTWSSDLGLQFLFGKEQTTSTSCDPLAVWAEITKLSLNERRSGIIVLYDYHPYWESPDINRRARTYIQQIRSKEDYITVIFVTPSDRIPMEWSREIVSISKPIPNLEDIKEIVNDFVTQNKLKDLDVPIISSAFRGLTSYEIVNLLAFSYIQHDKKLDPLLISREKAKILAQFVQVIDNPPPIESIGGLNHLKKWITSNVVLDFEALKNYGVPFPKGVLIVGVPGCGKSLTAKAIASSLQVPLLRLDLASLFGSLLGESEARARKVIEIASSMAPCVLWIDELEKTFGGPSGTETGSGSDTPMRVLSTFLTWMSEKDDPVFIAATANLAAQIPPELLRKGRFDEIFYVGLPSEKEREEIFQVHLSKYKAASEVELGSFKKFANSTGGYSGAEIERVVITALMKGFKEKQRKITSKDVMSSIDEVKSTTKNTIKYDEIKSIAQNASYSEVEKGKDSENVTLGLTRAVKRSNNPSYN